MSRILIVEDEVAIADLEKDYLELSGFEVEIENDGTKGLERALHEEFDLFILDLMLPGVGQLMGDGGPVYVDEEGFRVGADGIIYDNEDGALDQIQIVVPDNYDNLEFYDNGTYGAGAGVELSQVYPTVYQGKLEQSGVNLNNEMTRAMEVQRAFQSCGKALTIIDQMNQKTANEIGKL